MAKNKERLLGMKAKNIISNTLIYIVLTVMSIVWLIPFVCIVFQSFRTESTYQVGYVIPKQWGLDNYKNLFVNTKTVNSDTYVLTIGDETAKAKSIAKIEKAAAAAAAKEEARRKALEAAGKSPETNTGEVVVAKISTQSNSQVLCVGDTATFAIVAEGKNLTYQWQYLEPGAAVETAVDAAEGEAAEAGSEQASVDKDAWKDCTYASANSATLEVPVSESLDGYSYRCIVSGSYAFKTDFTKWYSNTFIIACIVSVLQTIFVLFMSYALSRFRFKLRKPLMQFMLVLGLFPGMLTLIILYRVLKDMGLTQANALPGLILVYVASSGMGYYVSKGFFDTIPMSLDEAARVDGATRAQVLLSMILPLSKPIVIYTILTAFMGPWADFVFAKYVSFNTSAGMNAAVGLYRWLSLDMINDRYTMFCAGGVVVAIPVTILFMCLQNYYVEGVTGGSVKG